MNLGPQNPGDDAFTRRMRLHQSWYRAHVLKVPCGTGPTPGSSRYFGNMLRREDGAAGRNFLTPAIFEVARRRVADRRGAVEPFRLMHNMLSSQPMCFNLFGPLVDDRALATRVARAAWGESIARVTRVEIEWAPEPASEFLDDRTAFDAFIEYERPDGRKGFVGIETKLTEPFSPRVDDKPTYRRWMDGASPWRDDAHGAVADRAHNQLWRDHLLAWALLRHPASSYVEGCLALVFHPLDRRCIRVVEGYRRLLRDERTFRAVTLDRLVDTWERAAPDAAWLREFRRRYLDLEASAHVRAPGPFDPPAGQGAPDDRDALPRPSAPNPWAAEPASLSGAPTIPGASASGNGEDRGGATARTSVVPMRVGRAVRAEHVRVLRRLRDGEAYRLTRAMYREALGGVDVFLRPTAQGFTVMSLDAQRCDSMIGVGGRGAQGSTITRLPPSRDEVARAAEGYRRKRDSLRRASDEERFALRLIAAALGGDLALPLPWPGYYFVTQEWRLPSSAKIDIVAIDLRAQALAIVELKGSRAEALAHDARKGGTAFDQARAYADEVFAYREELYPFFAELARTLARHHGAPEAMRNLSLDSNVPPRPVAVWPGGGRR